ILGEELEQSTASKQELEIERNRLNEAQAIAKTGSWELDTSSLDMRWSMEAYRIFELDPLPPNLLYEANRGRIHPEDLAMVLKSFRNAIDKAESFVVEHRIICT